MLNGELILIIFNMACNSLWTSQAHHLAYHSCVYHSTCWPYWYGLKSKHRIILLPWFYTTCSLLSSQQNSHVIGQWAATYFTWQTRCLSSLNTICWCLRIKLLVSWSYNNHKSLLLHADTVGTSYREVEGFMLSALGFDDWREMGTDDTFGCRKSKPEGLKDKLGSLKGIAEGLTGNAGFIRDNRRITWTAHGNK